MAKKYANKFKDGDGVWRTIGGRRVFIRTGQSLSDAMKESGKFKKNDDKGKKINETMDKRQKTIEKLDNDTKDLSPYDKYNLAVSKLENEDYSSPTERQYWVGEKERYIKNQKESWRDKLNTSEGRKEIFDKELDESTRSKMYDYYKPQTRNEEKRYGKDVKSKTMDQYIEDHNKKVSSEDISPMSEWSDTKGDGLSDLQRSTINQSVKNFEKDKEIESTIKSLYIYQDEPTMGTLRDEPLKPYYDMYGKDNVDRVWKEMDKKYVIAKGTNVDTEGLHYNNLINRSDYSPEAINDYLGKLNTLRNSGIDYYDTRQYNEKARELFNDLEKTKPIHFAGEELYSDDPHRYDDVILSNRYKGTINYLKKNTNLSSSEIFELIKKIDKEKK